MRELGLPFVGDMDQVDASAVEQEVDAALTDPESKLAPLGLCHAHLAVRAGNNFALVRSLLHAGRLA